MRFSSPGVIEFLTAAGGTTQLNFTDSGLLQKLQDPLGQNLLLDYNSKGELIKITAPGNLVTQFAYDDRGRLIKETDPLNQVVEYSYTGSLPFATAVRDQNGKKTDYVYNSAGELIKVVQPDGSAVQYERGLSGDVIKVIEASGDTFQFQYDAKGNITKKAFQDGTSQQFTYRADGLLASIIDAKGTTTFEYDSTNRLQKITDAKQRFVAYTYDSQGRRSSLTTETGHRVNYEYDTKGRLAKLTDKNGQMQVAYSYDTDGRLSKETNGNGTSTLYGYNLADQLISITNYSATGSINSYANYTYDAIGQQSSVTTADGKWAYQYDATGQLIKAVKDYSDANLVDLDLRYNYDSAGNRSSSTVNGSLTSYTVNQLNQYTQVGDKSYQYDADGNLTRIAGGGQVWTFGYNSENRLVSATTPHGSFVYDYDALGNRSAVVTNGQRTDFLMDPFGWGDVIGEYNAAGAPTANYLHGIGLVSQVKTGGEAFYYDSDAIGSTIGLSDKTGVYKNQYSYLPFGESLSKSEATANPFEYVGQWGVMDDDSGLDYMRARYYTPSTGGFMNRDPMGQEGGLNLYSYAINKPISFIDPEGTTPLLPLALAGAAIGGIWGVASYGVSSAISGDFSFRGAAGAFAGGAFYGGVIGATGGLSLAYGIPIAIAAGAAGNALGYGVSNYGTNNFSTSGLGGAALDGAVTGWIPWKVPGIKRYGLGAPGFSNTFLGLNKHGRGLWKGLGISALASTLWVQGKETVSPLVLDLDNDGIELISLQQSNAQFDLDADSFAEWTGWVKADDGLLAIDRNNNYLIDDITELFGNATTDGFIILKQLDSNNDNLISASDAQYANLRIWQDHNENGISEIGELRSLSDWAISSINLNYTALNESNQGHRISSSSSYTLESGATRKIVDVWFALNQTISTYNKEYQLKPETLFLPTLRGYGTLPDLHISMSKDPSLLAMMRGLVSLDTSNYEVFISQHVNRLEALLYKWAGVEAIPIKSRGIYTDGRKLAFLETFFGEKFFQSGGGMLGGPTAADPGPNASNTLAGIWNQLVRSFSGRILVQGALNRFYNDVFYDSISDSLVTSSDLDTLLASLRYLAPTDKQSIIYWGLVVSGLDAFEDRFGLTQSQYDQRINQTLANVGLANTLTKFRQPDFLQAFAQIIFGTPGDDILNGSLGDDQINGLAGNDKLMGNAGNDVLDGGIGNDSLYGGDGNDIIKAGQGIDSIDGGPGRDTLDLDLSGEASSLQIVNVLNGGSVSWISSLVSVESLRLSTGGGSDRIIQDAFLNGIVFRSDDDISAGAGDDTINAGLGLNDRIDGGAGDDLLILDYSIDDIGEQLTLNVSQGAEGYSGSAGRRSLGGGAWLDSFSFSGVNRLHITATKKGDYLYASGGNDTINGGDGNDTNNGGTGTNAITGGKGDDSITSSSSSIDTYFFNLGDGADTINTYDSTPNDSVQFGAGISASNISLERSGYSLIFKVGAGTDRITVRDWFYGSSYQLSALRFADGSTLTNAQIALLPVPQFGTAGND
ncbi:MAG: RHS repeat-associated core domain-containing protein, partial [Cyanobacteriota bacterium]